MRTLLGAVMALLLPSTIAAGQALAVQGSAFDYTFTAIDGRPMPLDQWRGKVLLVVNTASFCGFTQQYKGLQALHETYESRGLVVIGVPSNDFGGQEPGSSEQIKEFCEGAFGITFPLTEKVSVKGSAAHPLYRWVSDVLGASAQPGWNFHKYLIGRDGRSVQSFPSGVTPQSTELVSAIEQQLAVSISSK